MLPVPSAEELHTHVHLIDLKDLHVLAAALEGGSDFLLTLDRKQILAARDGIQEATLPIRILTPGDFIRRFYQLHKAYPSLHPRRES